MRSDARLLVVLASTVVIFLLSAASAQAGFAPPVGYGVGSYPKGVAVADFNGDGKADLAVANDDVSVLLGDGSGAFAPAVDYAVDSYTTSVAVGDFNSDGTPDLAVTTGDPGVSILLGDGSGGFAAAVDYPVVRLPSAVAVGDFNGDATPDLAVTDGSTNPDIGSGFSILLGTGNGGFAAAIDYWQWPSAYEINALADSVAVSDFDGDGKADLAVTVSWEVNILFGDGSGDFYLPDYYIVGGSPCSLAMGDFNGDGKTDLVTANNDWHDVAVLLGDGSGAFAPAVHYAAGLHPTSVAVADFNGDGAADLAVANYGDPSVSVLLGDGNGAFAPTGDYAAGAAPEAAAVADFNGDGKADLAVANDAYPQDDTVSVLLGDGDFLPVSICVVPGDEDNIGGVLDAMGKGYDRLDPIQLEDWTLAPFTTLCIASGAMGDPSYHAPTLRAWVNGGGSLYVSDHAYAYLNYAFPGKVVIPTYPAYGNAGEVVATVLDRGLAWYLDPGAPPATVSLSFEDGWLVPTGVGAGTTTYLRGTVSTDEGEKPNTPLLVGFKSGEGRAFYTAFHNHPQLSVTEQRLLEYLVLMLMPESGDLASSLRQSLLAGRVDWSATFEGLYGLDDGETSPAFLATPTAGRNLLIGADWADARVRLDVFRPSGTLYASREADQGAVEVEIPAAVIDASPGTWTYKLVGIAVPDASHVVAVASFIPAGTQPAIASLTSASHPDPALWYRPRTARFSWSVGDPTGMAGYSYTIDQAPGGGADDTIDGTGLTASLPSLADGIWYFHVRACDMAGTWGPSAHLMVRSDGTPPVTVSNAGGTWHQAPFTLTLAATDAFSGMSGGFAKTEYSTDAGVSWVTGTNLLFSGWKRGGGSGIYPVRVRSTDNAGNVEGAKTMNVKIDTSPPTSKDDAPTTPRSVPTTVHFTGADYSGIAGIWYSLDGGAWTQGSSVTIPAPTNHTNDGLHTIRYYAVDNAGNRQVGYNVCTVTIKTTLGASGLRLVPRLLGSSHRRAVGLPPSLGNSRHVPLR